jgi:[acyl-carrier-protein] S-malonyltransferase
MSAAFLFPGQGSQYVGMGSDYLKAYPSVAHRFEQASDCLGTDLKRVVAMGPRNVLVQTDLAQVAIYTLSVAIAELLAARGVVPVAVAGHSLGQFSALAVTGAMTFEDGLSLVADRGRFMHEQNQAIDGSMFAVTGLELDAIERAVEGIGQVWIANYNAPGQTILSGLRPALEQAQERLRAAGGRATWFDVAGPYHTPLLATAAAQFALSVQRLPLRDAIVPLIANSDAAPLIKADALRDELSRHMLVPVRWSDTLHRIAAMNVRLLVEVGPGKVLKGLALRKVPDIRCVGTDTARELVQTCSMLLEAGSCVSS